MNTPFENNAIYTNNGKFYLNINGTTAINLMMIYGNIKLNILILKIVNLDYLLKLMKMK